MKFSSIFAVAILLGSAEGIHLAPNAQAPQQHLSQAAKGGVDKYAVTNEYEKHWAREKGHGGYNVDAVESFSSKEDAALPTPLDGEALTREIGGASLTGELNDRTNGAGIKDKGDLADLLASIKGAEVFMNKTPKEQL